MDQYSSEDLANILNGAHAFFSDTPPPGQALGKAIAGLPETSITQASPAVVRRFDMGGFNFP